MDLTHAVVVEGSRLLWAAAAAAAGLRIAVEMKETRKETDAWKCK